MAVLMWIRATRARPLRALTSSLTRTRRRPSAAHVAVMAPARSRSKARTVLPTCSSTHLASPWLLSLTPVASSSKRRRMPDMQDPVSCSDRQPKQLRNKTTLYIFFTEFLSSKLLLLVIKHCIRGSSKEKRKRRKKKIERKKKKKG